MPDDRIFVLLTTLGILALVMLGLVLVGLYRLAHRLVEGWLHGLDRLVENSSREHAEIRESVHRVGDAVINLHTWIAGAPEMLPGPFASTRGPSPE